VTDRAARGCLTAVLLALAGIAVATDLPAASSGQFWNDGATYYTMASSLARDFDLVYENKDLDRVKLEYPTGPQGVFLKRASGGLVFDSASGFPWIRRLGPSERRIYFAKAFAYPVAAAPFVWLFGTRGLLLTNAIFLALFAGLGYGELCRHAHPAASLAVVLALLFATVTPLYLFWPQPEIFNLGVLTAALVAWRRDRILVSALLFGLATYAKPTNALLALPLGFAPLLGAAHGLAPGLRESFRRALLVVVAAGALYGVNAVVTGEANYQGGERKTFYGHFPADLHTTFGNSGIWMTTSSVGPVVTEQAQHARAIAHGVIVRSSNEMRETFVRNLGYFWIGRFAGALLYFVPAVVAVAFLVCRGPRESSGLLALVTMLISAVVYVWLIPDNWYGGGGTVGNRYFLNLLPLVFFLTPRGAAARVAALGSLGLLFVLPMFAAPIESSLQPWRHALRPLFRAFPAELTMLNDLSICADPWRKKQPFGDPEGDLAQGRPADPKAFWIYFPDDGTYGKEKEGHAEGFWTRGGASAELLLRALEPVRRMQVRVDAGPAGDVVTARAGDSRGTLVLQPHQTGTIELVPGRGMLFYDSLLYVVQISSRTGGSPGPADPRSLGSFVRIDLDVDRRER